MAAPATEDLRELERELTIAAESGEARSFAELREQFGLGHDDLEQALATLREHGKAVEAAPGEWRGPLMDELAQVTHPGSMGDGADPEAPRVRVHVGDEREFEDVAAIESGGNRVEFGRFAGDADVRLTRAIADALDADALGKIVKAGLEGVDPEQPFTLEVLP